MFFFILRSIKLGGIMKNILIVLAAALVVTCQSLAKSEIKEIYSMTEAFKEIQNKIAQYGKDQVLVVFDLDSTLLSLNQDLGSDYWFSWQQSKIKSGDKQDRVSNSVNELASVQRQLYSLSKMSPPEHFTVGLVKHLSIQRIPSMILTSRFTDFRDITESHLKENEINFADNSPEVISDQTEDFIPYDPTNPEKYGLTADDLNLNKENIIPRVSYKKGLFLSAGLHKGLALKSFVFKKSKKQNYKAIIFVDDKKYHCEAVASVYEKSPVDVVSLRYGFEDSRVNSFNQGKKLDSINGYYYFTEMKKRIFKH